MKLNRTKILEILRKKNEGLSSYKVKKQFGISERRVNQLWKEYRETEEIPVIGKRVGRPVKQISDEEREVVKAAFKTYRMSASLLEPLIRRDYERHIPHNRIHKILLEAGLANKQKHVYIRKRKWIRYERKHSLSAVHMDWHQRPNDGPWICPVLDDASRYVLSAGEHESPTTKSSIDMLEKALTHGPIREVITDHGSQFTSNVGGKTKFGKFLKQHDIRHILCRIKHPQTNGKVEKWFHLYESHRDAFHTLPTFLAWYNTIRPHTSLAFSRLETPWQAFQRKMRKN